MKATKILTTLFLAASLAACSAKITTQEDSTGTPQSGQENKELLISKGGNQVYNAIAINDTTRESWSFDYTLESEEDMWIAYQGGSSFSMGCEGDYVEALTWIPHGTDGLPQESVAVTSFNQKLEVKKGIKYILHIDLTNTKGCQLSLSYEFSETTAPVEESNPGKPGTPGEEEGETPETPEEPTQPEAFKVGEEALTTGNFLSINIGGDKHSAVYKDFTFESVSNKNLYISSTSDSYPTGCSDEVTKEIQWLTLDENGDIEQTQTVQGFDDFYAIANKKHILRYYIKGIENCSFGSTSLYVSSW